MEIYLDEHKYISERTYCVIYVSGKQRAGMQAKAHFGRGLVCSLLVVSFKEVFAPDTVEGRNCSALTEKADLHMHFKLRIVCSGMDCRRARKALKIQTC